MRILCIDPGGKNIGIALSDPTGSLANPLTVIRHTSRDGDAAAIAKLAKEKTAELVIIGQALDMDGKPTVSGRSAARLAAAIQSKYNIPVLLWDESHSTQEAQAFIRKKKHGWKHDHLIDDLAAAIILQSYLDSHLSADSRQD